MSSRWTNKYAIMRDLSMAQGCVPVDVDKTVAANQKPPTPHITEDTEEEFFRHCVGSGDFHPPDLGLIKQMLDLVRDEKISSDSENEEEKILQITKLNPTAPEFTIQKKVQNRLFHDSDVQPSKESKTHKNKNKDHKRNVAVTSILENIANKSNDKKEQENTAKSSDLTILLKANEPPQSQTVTNSVEKVSIWLDSNQKEKVRKTPLLMDPITMFKKKVNVSPPKPAKETVIKSPPSVSTHYKPSSQAAEYYKKYLEKSQLKSQITEDIWAKAEREMKEIDAKRKREAEESLVVSPCSLLALSETDPSSGSQEADTSGSSPVTSSDARLDIIKLPQHRHLLTGECIVCKVVGEKAFRDTIKLKDRV